MLRRDDIVVMDNCQAHKAAGIREAIEKARGDTCATCRSTRPTSIRSRCRSANSRHSCARPPSELFPVSTGPFARSCHASVLKNVPTTSGMRAMLHMTGKPSSFSNENGVWNGWSNRAEPARGAATIADCIGAGDLFVVTGDDAGRTIVPFSRPSISSMRRRWSHRSGTVFSPRSPRFSMPTTLSCARRRAGAGRSTTSGSTNATATPSRSSATRWTRTRGCARSTRVAGGRFIPDGRLGPGAARIARAPDLSQAAEHRTDVWSSSCRPGRATPMISA